jgi:hypothetical protein
MRGLFARGLDDGKGNDPDSAFRVIGSTQSDSFQAHFHRAYFRDYGYGGTGSSTQLDAMQQDSPMVTTGGDPTTGARAREEITNGTNGTPRTGNETRSENMAWAYMIKYRVNVSTQGGILDQANSFTVKQTVPALTVTGSTTTAGGLVKDTIYSNNIIKASLVFGGSSTIIKGFNVSSITDNSQGNFTIAWVIPFANANYCVQVLANNGVPYEFAHDANSINICILDNDFSGAYRDSSYISVIAVGEQ